MHKLAKIQKLLGAPLAPLESFLLSRGLRTLHVRMERHGENAMAVAEMLDKHPLVASTFYPGLASHPDHALAKTVFSSGGKGSDRPQTYGGMLAFIVAGDADTALARARRLCEHLKVVTLAVSLGGTESLIEHPASMTHAMVPREDRLAGGLADGLVRLSVGLEDSRDLVNDLKQALDACDTE
uniref:cystathionine gamma-lyase n=2 Tax=Chrysotila carterae TaxID=13221 RepID=A0A6T0F9K3_CHRCT